MKTTTPVEFGSALNFLEHAALGDNVIVTRLQPNARYRSDMRVEVIGRVIGATEKQTTLEGTGGLGKLPDINEITKTTVHFEGGRSLAFDWDSTTTAVTGFVQVLS